MTEDSTFVRHEPCPECHSSDNLARYTDGHGHCFGCGYYQKGEGEPTTTRRTPVSKEFIQGEDFQKSVRGISPATFQHWKYKIDLSGDTPRHIANHFINNRLTGQKVRGANKKFKVIGEMDHLYGKWLWSPTKRLVITEGEIDALSVSQVQNNKWPVVSVPNGAQGAAKAVRNSIDWIDQFDEVVFMFDMDAPGLKAAEECAALLRPGKAKIAKLPAKDANELLKDGKGEDILRSIWNAEVYRPDGIVTVKQMHDEVMRPVEWGLSWPWPKLTNATYGRRPGDLISLGAGTGIGKTDFLTECILWDLEEHKLNVGVLMLEQAPRETIQRIAGKLAGKKFHVPKDDAGWTVEELESAMTRLEENAGLYLYDSFGSIDWETIEQRMRYLAISCGCKHIYLDHLTALAAHAEDERRAIEEIMADLAGMAKELQVVIHIVSHLATPEGKSHEEGGRVQIRHFKGSRSIGFWSYFMIGLERNQQEADESMRNVTTVRVLKDRYTGQSTGYTFALKYLHETGRLEETELATEAFDAEDGGIY